MKPLTYKIIEHKFEFFLSKNLLFPSLILINLLEKAFQYFREHDDNIYNHAITDGKNVSNTDCLPSPLPGREFTEKGMVLFLRSFPNFLLNWRTNQDGEFIYIEENISPESKEIEYNKILKPIVELVIYSALKMGNHNYLHINGGSILYNNKKMIFIHNVNEHKMSYYLSHGFKLLALNNIMIDVKNNEIIKYIPPVLPSSLTNLHHELFEKVGDFFIMRNDYVFDTESKSKKIQIPSSGIDCINYDVNKDLLTNSIISGSNASNNPEMIETLKEIFILDNLYHIEEA